MKPIDIEQYFTRIDYQTQLIEASYKSIREKNSEPPKGKWNLYQQVEHLTKITESYFPTFDLLLSKKYQLRGLAAWRPFANFIGKFILKSVQPNAKAIKTFPVWEPKGIDKVRCWNNFVKSQDQLKVYIKRLEPEIQNHRIIHSPANKSISYTLPTTLEIILDHQLRHLEQIKNL
jgi:hypothetical protein